MKRKIFSQGNALAGRKPSGQKNDSTARRKRLTAVVSTVLACVLLTGVVLVALPGSNVSAASTAGVINSVYGESVIPAQYEAMNVPAGTKVMTEENFASGKVTESGDGLAAFDFHIFADVFSSGIHTCGNIAVNKLGWEVLGKEAAPEFGSRQSHDIDVPKLSYVGDLKGWTSATTNEYLVFGPDVEVQGEKGRQVQVQLNDGSYAMMGNDNNGQLLDSIYIENNGQPITDDSQRFINIQKEMDEVEDYQRMLVWLMRQANKKNYTANLAQVKLSDGTTETVQYLNYNDVAPQFGGGFGFGWGFGFNGTTIDFSKYKADTIIVDLDSYYSYNYWTGQNELVHNAQALISGSVKMTGTAGKRIIFNVNMTRVGDTFKFSDTNMSADKISNSEEAAMLDNNILWNFYTVEGDYDTGLPKSYEGTVSMGGTWVGTVLVPEGTVSCAAGLNGSIIADKVATYAETHKSDYTGERVTKTTVDVTVTKVWRDSPSLRPAFVTIQLLRDGKVINSVQVTAENGKVTDANGAVDQYTWKYTFEDLPAADPKGTSYQYKVAEIVPDGYVMDQVGNTIVNTSTAAPEEVVPTYALTVNKTDANGVFLADAVMVLTAENGSNLSAAAVSGAKSYTVTDGSVTWTTGNEKVVISNLPAGTYIVRESSAPAGYKLAAEQKVTVNSNASVNVVDQSIDVVLNKYNGENNYKDQLPGASFKLTANWGTTLSTDMVSGAQEVKLENGALTWKNGSSAVTLKGIAAGSYTLTETAAPKGYDVAAPVTFIVNPDGTFTVNGSTVSSVDVYNYLTPAKEETYSLSVSKTGGTKVNAQALPNAKLTLVNVAGKDLTDLDNAITSNVTFTYGTTNSTNDSIVWTTGGSTVSFNGLPAGSYLLKETGVPNGYEKAADISITLNANGEVTMHDESIEIFVSKLDATSGAELKNAVLTLKSDDGISLNDVTSSNVALNKNGTEISWSTVGAPAVLTKLPAGNYTLTETSAPAGYSAAAQQKFRVDENGNIYNVNGAEISGTTVIMRDQPVIIEISKLFWNDAIGSNAGSIDNGETGILAGAKLQLTETTGKSLANVSGTITVSHDADNIISWTSGSKANSLRGLPDGSYKLTELSAPAGFDSAKEIEFTIGDSNEYDSVVEHKIISCTKPNTGDDYTDASVSMCDKKTIMYSVQVKKIDASNNGVGLAGATIGIFAEGTTTFTGDTAIAVYDSTTEPKDLILANGNYILRELSAPAGYDLNDECIAFTVYNGEVKDVEAFTITSEVKVDKLSAENANITAFTDKAYPYSNITEYVAANGQRVPDEVIVKVPVANAGSISEMGSTIVFIDENGSVTAGSSHQYWNTGSNNTANDQYAYRIEKDGYYYYHFNNPETPNLTNQNGVKSDVDINAGIYKNAYLILNGTNVTTMEAWKALEATISVVYGDTETVLGEKEVSTVTDSAFTLGAVPTINWSNAGNAYLYKDITDILLENGSAPAAIKITAPDGTTGMYSITADICYGNTTDYNSCGNISQAYAENKDLVYSSRFNGAGKTYADFVSARNSYSDVRAYLALNLNGLDSSTVDFSKYTVSIDFEKRINTTNELTYADSFGDMNTCFYVDLKTLLNDWPTGVKLESNGERCVIRYKLFDADQEPISSQVSLEVDSNNPSKTGSISYDIDTSTAFADYSGAVYIAVQVEYENQKLTELPEIISLITPSGEKNIVLYDPGEVEVTTIDIATAGGKHTVTKDDIGSITEGGKTVGITLPNTLTPVADRYLYSVQLTKKDDNGTAITWNPATFLLYDENSIPVKLTGSNGSYEYDFDGAADLSVAQNSFSNNGTAFTASTGYTLTGVPAAINYSLPGGYTEGSTLQLKLTCNGKTVELPVLTLDDVKGTWADIDLSELGITNGSYVTIEVIETSEESAATVELDFVYPLVNSNEAGTLTVNGLWVGDYYFVETKAPTNYKNEIATAGFALNEWNTEGNPAKVTLVNTAKTGSLNIVKTDDNGRALSGAKFNLYSVATDYSDRDNPTLVALNTTTDPITGQVSVGSYDYGTGSGWVTELVTGNDGQIKLTNLPLNRIYYVVEIGAAPGTSNTNGSSKLPSLAVAGSAYYNDSYRYGTALGENISTIIPTVTWTDTNGNGILDDAEKDSAVASSTTQSVTKYEDVITVSNQAFTTTIVKKDAQGNALAHAKLMLAPVSVSADLNGVSGDGVTVNNTPVYDQNGQQTGVSQSITWTTGDAAVIIRGLPEGLYKLTETEAPVGYETAEPVFVRIDASGNATYSATENGEYKSGTVEMTDKQKTGTITLTKRDAESNERLASVQFKLKVGDAYVNANYADGAYTYTGLTADGKVMTTDANGQIVVTGLPYNTTYVFEEIAAPAGYIKAESIEGVTLTAIDLQQEIDVTNARDDNAVITLLKKDIDGTAINGAKFELYSRKANSGEAYELVGTYTTENGQIALSGLKWDREYKFVETEAAAGYDINTVSYTASSNVTITTGDKAVVFTVGSNTGDVTITAANEKLASLKIVKSWDDNNDQDGQRPDSVTVQLYANEVASGAPVELNAGNSWTHVWADLPVVDANGARINYTADETAVPAGYTKTGSGLQELNGETVWVVTNYYSTASTVVAGTKHWVDDSDRDGIRPDSITVNLVKGGDVIDSQTVTAANNWSYSFGNLPKYEGGALIAYTVSEEAVEGYTATYNGYDITNTHETETVTVSGTKTWVDDSNRDGLRPGSITVNLLADGAKVDSVTVTADNGWTYSFTGLNKNRDSGTPIVYTVTEESVGGYTATYDGYNITNTHETETVTVSGTKTWVDDTDRDGLRPDSITVNLLADGTKVDSATVTADNGWTYSFTGLNKNKDSGTPIVYTVEEVAVSGYTATYDGYNITNTHETDTITVSGTKTWSDDSNRDGLRPTSITVNLLADGEKIDSATVTADNGWTYSFTGLDKNRDGGTAIIYTVTEDPVTGYTPAYNGYNITNTHENTTITVSGTKTWVDDNNQDGARPASITVNLLADGEKVDSAVVTAGDEGVWSYSFTGLNKYRDGGTAIVYTVEEETVPGYTATYNGYSIINTHEAEQITISGTKTWVDNGDQDGIRPASITVNLLADGTEVDSAVVTDDGEGVWSYSFTGLDKYKNGGTAIVYTVEEEAVPGYTTTYSGYNIINTHNTEKTVVSGTKTWNDADDQDGIRPASITVNLVVDGEVIKTTTATAENGWAYSFTDLDKFADGTLIVYEITEEAVEGYNSLVSGTDLINTHTPTTTQLTVTKVWSDADDQDGIRPAEVTVQLKANGKDSGSAVKLNESNSWTYTWEDLAVKAGGRVVEYTVVETAVDGYTVSYSDITDGEITITNTHAPTTADITISKQDINGTGELPNAVLTLKPMTEGVSLANVEGSIEIKYSPETGFISWTSGTEANELTRLPVGQYTLTETTAPFGYAVDEDIVFSVDANGVVTIDGQVQDGSIVVMKDEIIVVNISKKDVNDTDELEGATLTLTPMDKDVNIDGVQSKFTTTPSEKDNSISWVSGTENNVLTGLPAGVYCLTETTAPFGYEIAENIVFTVTADGKVIVDSKLADGNTVTMKDEVIVVNISKKDINGTSELAGATLTLTPMDKDVNIDGVQSKFTTTPSEEDNSISWVSGTTNNVLTGLPAGIYTLTETTAPDGYEKTEDIVFTVDEKGQVLIDGKVQDGDIVVMKDEPITATISKVDINTTEEIPGALLTITPVASDTDLSGVTGTIEVDFNEETGAISWTSEDEPNILSKLPAGEYVLTENIAPDGYAKTESITFSVDDQSKVTIGGKEQKDGVVIMKDAPNQAVISKKAVSGDDELSGAELTVRLVAPVNEDANLKKVTGTEEIECSSDGMSVTWVSGATANTLTMLPDGVYTLTEVRAPAGYKVAEQIFFKVENGKVYNTTSYNAANTTWTEASKNTVVMYDEQISVAINFIKRSNLSKVLPGAEFTLTDSKGTAVTATSDANGVVSFDNLKEGTYTLTETKAPTGYSKSGQTIKVEVSATGTVVWRDASGYQLVPADVEKALTNTYIIQPSTPQTDLNVGDKVDLSDKLEDVLGSIDIDWESSDNSIATVDKDGNVTMLKPGQVTITAKHNGETVKQFVLGANAQQNNNTNNTVPNTGSDIVRISLYVSGALLGAFAAATAVIYGVKRRRSNRA